MHTIFIATHSFNPYSLMNAIYQETTITTAIKLQLIWKLMPHRLNLPYNGIYHIFGNGPGFCFLDLGPFWVLIPKKPPLNITIFNFFNT